MFRKRAIRMKISCNGSPAKFGLLIQRTFK
jgi:hypothetical protein